MRFMFFALNCLLLLSCSTHGDQKKTSSANTIFSEFCGDMIENHPYVTGAVVAGTVTLIAAIASGNESIDIGPIIEFVTKNPTPFIASGASVGTGTVLDMIANGEKSVPMRVVRDGPKLVKKYSECSNTIFFEKIIKGNVLD